MITISKPVRATAETFKNLKILAAQEGLTIGKMLEVLIEFYRKNSKNGE